MKKAMSKGRAISLCIVAALFAAGSLTVAGHGNAQGTFNHPGNILITDQFNNRVIEIDPAGNIVWQFGLGPGNTTPSSITGTNDAERVGTLTLMSGTGIPPATVTHCKKGCADNRVLLVDQRGNIVWQYGQFGVTGSGPNQLNTPVQNTYLSTGPGTFNVLITDQGNERIIEVRSSDNAIMWQYGTTGVIGIGTNQLSNPNAAELLTSGNILISDENNNRAIEVTHTMPSTIIQNGIFTGAGGLAFFGVAFASRLPNGHTLITDSGNSRIVETDACGNASCTVSCDVNCPVYWQFLTNDPVLRPGSNPSPLPTRAVQLANGNILISDQFNHQVIEVTHTTPAVIVASYGKINSPGYNPSTAVEMNGPYSAYVIGDYTGITPP